MLMVYCYNSNYIHIDPMPSRTAYQILLTYQHAHKLLVSRGLLPLFQCFDNEASAVIINYMDQQGGDFQLTPLEFTGATQLNV